jgi:thiamine biosynthesis protein ThiS
MSQLHIIVNGQETSVDESSALSDLVRSLGLNPERVAIELNRKIVRRKDWSSTTISDGDRVEIVHFVGGGSTVDNYR